VDKSGVLDGASDSRALGPREAAADGGRRAGRLVARRRRGAVGGLHRAIAPGDARTRARGGGGDARPRSPRPARPRAARPRSTSRGQRQRAGIRTRADVKWVA